MAQQTAVEFLEKKFKEKGFFYLWDFEQAKQMEEEEKKKVIVKAWQDGFDTGNYISTTTGGWNGDGEDYYEKTYKIEQS